MSFNDHPDPRRVGLFLATHSTDTTVHRNPPTVTMSTGTKVANFLHKAIVVTCIGASVTALADGESGV